MAKYYIFGPSPAITELRQIAGPFDYMYGQGLLGDTYGKYGSYGVMIEQAIADGFITNTGTYLVVAEENDRTIATSHPIEVRDFTPPPPKSALRVV
jgi:hypothetical protein